MEGRKVPVWKSKKEVKNKKMLSEFHKKKRVERYNKKNLLPTFLDVNSGWDDLLGPKNRYSEDFNGKCEKPGNE